MILTIDNLDMAGPRDYSGYLAGTRLPKVTRKYNQPAALQAWLTAEGQQMLVPRIGARIELRRRDGSAVFTGYLTQAPQQEFLGSGVTGPISCFALTATGEEYVLDRQMLAARAPITGKTGGGILQALTGELTQGLDTSGVQQLEMLAPFTINPELNWSQHAAQLGVMSRAVYRVHDRKLTFAPPGAQTVLFGEQLASFDEAALKLVQSHDVVNDVTVLGPREPQGYIKDYFQGNGTYYWFTLSEQPYSLTSSILIEEKYTSSLASQFWQVVDPNQAIASGGGDLAVNGGTGSDGQTYLALAETLELGGAVVLQHGEVSFSAASQAIVGGLYAGAISAASCLAGFAVTKSGTASTIQALVNGAPTGTQVTTTSGHRYAFVTRFYCVEPFRTQQLFHSALHQAGAGAGGASIAADLKVVMELRDIDPTNPATMVAAPTVLFDGVIAGAPAFASYAVVNAADLHCTLAYTEVVKCVPAEVRVTPSGSTTSSSKIIGAQVDGADCEITTSPEVVFYSYSTPNNGDAIEVSYRASGTAMGREQSAQSIAGLAGVQDTGVRSAVVRLTTPEPRSSSECRSAAATMLEDSTTAAWSGQYKCWGDQLPVEDTWPGDDISISLPSRALQVQATIRQVGIEFLDYEDDCSQYTIEFANDAAQSLSVEVSKTKQRPALSYSAEIPGTAVPCLPHAEVTSVQYATVAIDAGAAPVAGGGIEVRLKDAGWGADEQRNLLGRFTTQTFTAPRMAKDQNYYLRMFDGSTPPNYSPFSTLLHVDYP